MTSMTVYNSFSLTDDQIRFFDTNGYLQLPDRIEQGLIVRTQNLTTKLIEEAKRDLHDGSNIGFRDLGGQRFVFRIEKLHLYNDPVTLELMGCPQLLSIAEGLCRPNFVPVYESVIVRQAGDSVPVKWHQDTIHSRTNRVFTLGIYLDESRNEGNALRLIPGSQHEKADLCRIEREFGWNAPNSVQVEMNPGDVLLHDVMTVHSSEANPVDRDRRTVYFEFRSLEQMLDEGHWSEHWLKKRMRVLSCAIQTYRETHPDQPYFIWNADPQWKTEVSKDETQEIIQGVYNDPQRITPAVYCFEFK